MIKSEITQKYSLLEREIDSALEDNRSTLGKIADMYFKPKSFEKNGKLYEVLGIKWFRKYCPNAGSKFSLTGSLVSGRKKKDLELFNLETKRLEGVHAFGLLPLYTALTAMDLADKDYVSAGIYTALNLLINVYPYY